MTIPTKWTHQGKIVEQLPDDCEGFVYLITNLANNRKYIGKKLARFKVTRHLKAEQIKDAQQKKVIGEIIGVLLNT